MPEVRDWGKIGHKGHDLEKSIMTDVVEKWFFGVALVLAGYFDWAGC
jgi:hypothetical protein